MASQEQSEACGVKAPQRIDVVEAKSSFRLHRINNGTMVLNPNWGWGWIN